jgi:hypothetical protein
LARVVEKFLVLEVEEVEEVEEVAAEAEEETLLLDHQQAQYIIHGIIF